MNVMSKLREKLTGTALPYTAALLLMVATCTPAHAQFEKMTRNFNWVYATVAGLAVIVFSVLIVAAGFEVGIRHRKLMDVWPIVVGAALSGSGAVVAALLI
jgi:hypothetical protein